MNPSFLVTFVQNIINLEQFLMNCLLKFANFYFFYTNLIFFGTGYSNIIIIFFCSFECFQCWQRIPKIQFFLWNSYFLGLKITQPLKNKSIFFAHVKHGVFVHQNKSKYRRNKSPLFYPNMFLKHYWSIPG